MSLTGERGRRADGPHQGHGPRRPQVDGLEHPHSHPEAHLRPTEPSRGVAVDVGDGMGALVLYAEAAHEWAEPEIHPIDAPGNRRHVWVLERLVGTGSVYAAVFPSLPAGTYGICSPEGLSTEKVEIVSGQVTTASWR